MLTLRYCAIIASGLLACVSSRAAQPPDSVVSDSNLNTAMGSNAMFNNGTTSENTAAGYAALFSNSAGGYNSALGAFALYSNTDGYFNSAFGRRALYLNTFGTGNSALGSDALGSNTTGDFNSAIGISALNSNTSGGYNSALGSTALAFNSTGFFNSAFGAEALGHNTTGSYNSAIGVSALFNNTTASYNTAVGYRVLTSNFDGAANTALGFQSLLNASHGNNNTAVGYAALSNDLTGSGNIAVGYNAGYNITRSNNIDIGNQGASNDNGVIRIGAANSNNGTFIAGITNTQLIGAAVYVNANGKLGVLASSERYKTAIRSMSNEASKLERLRPVSFHLKNDPDGPLQYGLIAEEVQKVFPELVIRDAQGKIQGVRYDELAPMLLDQVQRQSAENRQLQQQMFLLKRQNEAILAALSQLQSDDARVVQR